jgi:glycosyltransferase A (GT-A) superfamily protein (DUF2064 family)
MNLIPRIGTIVAANTARQTTVNVLSFVASFKMRRTTAKQTSGQTSKGKNDG